MHLIDKMFVKSKLNHQGDSKVVFYQGITSFKMHFTNAISIKRQSFLTFEIHLFISDHIFSHCNGPLPILGGPKSRFKGTDIGDTEGDLVAKGDNEG